jgi:hypothetical protein
VSDIFVTKLEAKNKKKAAYKKPIPLVRIIALVRVPKHHPLKSIA